MSRAKEATDLVYGIIKIIVVLAIVSFILVNILHTSWSYVLGLLWKSAFGYIGGGSQ